MSKVEQIKARLEQLSPAELRQIRDWLDDFVEDTSNSRRSSRQLFASQSVKWMRAFGLGSVSPELH